MATACPDQIGGLKVKDVGMTFTFDPKEHLYALDGKPLPGVTTILKVRQKPFLAPWYAKEAIAAVKAEWNPFTPYSRAEFDKLADTCKGAAERKSRAGRETGTDIHGYIAAVLTGKPVPIVVTEDLGAYNATKAFNEWHKELTEEILAVELKVYSVSHWFAGTLDLLTRRADGGYTIRDFKTNKSVADDWGLQTEAYVLCLEEMVEGWPRLEGDLSNGMYSEMGGMVNRKIVRLPKTPGKAQEIPASITSREQDRAAFLACRMVYRWNTAHEAAYEAENGGTR